MGFWWLQAWQSGLVVFEASAVASFGVKHGTKFSSDGYTGPHSYLHNNYGEIFPLGFKGRELGLSKLGLCDEFITRWNKNQHKYVFALIKNKKKKTQKPIPLSCFTNLWIQLIFNMEVKFPFSFFSPFKPDIYF